MRETIIISIGNNSGSCLKYNNREIVKTFIFNESGVLYESDGAVLDIEADEEYARKLYFTNYIKQIEIEKPYAVKKASLDFTKQRNYIVLKQGYNRLEYNLYVHMNEFNINKIEEFEYSRETDKTKYANRYYINSKHTVYTSKQMATQNFNFVKVTKEVKTELGEHIDEVTNILKNYMRNVSSFDIADLLKDYDIILTKKLK